MKLQKFDNADASKVLLGLITNSVVCSQIAPHWADGLFASRWENLVGRWAIKHFCKYGQPIGKDIVHSFEAWAAKNEDKATHELVNKFLTQLSQRYEAETESPNPEFICDLAGKHFNEVRAKKTHEEVGRLLQAGETEAAQAMMLGLKKIELGSGKIINVLEDEAAHERAFQQKSEPLIKFTHDPTRIFFGDALERDALIGIMASSKRGKTRWLIDLSWRAMLDRLKVLFLEVGDLSEAQIMRRFAGRAARRPLMPRKGCSWPCTWPWPTVIKRESGLLAAQLEVEERTFDAPLSWQMSTAACKQIIKKKTCTKTPLLKLAVYPNGSVSVPGIVGLVQNLEREGWRPDVISIDYCDLLAPINSKVDVRHQIRDNWAALRALSQVYHCLVITATQASAESYSAETVQKRHFGESKFKTDFVTGMLALSQTPLEKKDSIIRIHWIDVREMENDENSFLYCAGVPAISHPMITTCL